MFYFGGFEMFQSEQNIGRIVLQVSFPLQASEASERRYPTCSTLKSALRGNSLFIVLHSQFVRQVVYQAKLSV